MYYLMKTIKPLIVIALISSVVWSLIPEADASLSKVISLEKTKISVDTDIITFCASYSTSGNL